MLTEAPIPSVVEMQEISVTFLSQFLGALPKALAPSLGALARSGTRRSTLVEHSHLRTPEPSWVYPAQALPPSTSCLLVSLGGTQRLFLSVHPSSLLRIARLIVAMDTLAPCSRSHSSQWCSRVASSFPSSCSHNDARFSSSGVARMRRLRPVEEGLGARSSPPPAALDVAFDSRKGDPEEVCYLLAWEAAVHCFEHP